MKVNKYKVNKPLPDHDPSYGDLIVDIGRLFVNRPYKAETLESPGKEKLVVNLSAFDCTTFVETVLALVRCASTGRISRDQFRKNLKLIRYRQGKMDGYSSRLHYFSDWLRDNENKNILTDVSRSLGGKPQRKKIHFMTAHRESYSALGKEAQFAKMSVIEKNLSRKIFHIIEKDNMNAQKAKIHDGDIIAFATNQEGLDVAHVGFALWQGKSLRLLHASSEEGAVVISKKTLAAYLKSGRKFTGIIVARFL
ncbi:MAG: DUF1460 domain-containing protein [Deltaproteobacteria bacterium HGW-Deltaproteobacteria-13]|jgi:hypothetical protein|nr:MAG: DUF1460 domain-containing protein [Deltaproteobacteria bacterium HGW-Deltaproteobacteria-13]